jgi:uncharacterized protein (DUF58 family)
MDRDPFSRSLCPPRIAVTLIALGMIWSGLRLPSAPLLLLGLTLAFTALLAALWSMRVRRGLHAVRQHRDRVFELGAARVRVGVENRSALPLFGLEVRDVFPPTETYRVRMARGQTLWPRRGLALNYRRVCGRRRGVYSIGPITVGGADPAGLFPFREDLPVITGLHVYPSADAIALFPLLGEGTLSGIGDEIIDRAGMSPEFRGVREWRRGDGERGVHWPTSARLGRLMSKEFEQDLITEVTLCLDLRREALTGLGEHTSLEYAVKAAASLAETAIERQHLVQLWGLGGARRSHVPFGGGDPHLNLILDELTIVRADGEGAFAEHFEQVIPTLRSGSTLILIVSAAALGWAEVAGPLRALALDGVRLIAVLIDDRSLPSLFDHQLELHRDAETFDAIVHGLREIGAEVYTIAERESVHRRLEVPVR